MIYRALYGCMVGGKILFYISYPPCTFCVPHTLYTAIQCLPKIFPEILGSQKIDLLYGKILLYPLNSANADLANFCGITDALSCSQ